MDSQEPEATSDGGFRRWAREREPLLLTGVVLIVAVAVLIIISVARPH